MSYDPTNWKAGDVISSQKLNKLEQGVADAGGGGGNLVVTITKTEEGGEVTYTADKTAGEIKAAMESGQGVAIPYTMVNESGSEYVISKVGEGGSYDSNFVTESGMYALIVSSLITGDPDDLPLIAATLEDYPSGTGSK